jgi:DNA-binding PadR family transcriptional regulator
MTNKEMIIDVFSNYGAMTSRQAAVQVNNKHGVILTPSQVAGALRPLVAKGYAANSKDERNQTRYWITEEGKGHFAEEARKNG